MKLTLFRLPSLLVLLVGSIGLLDVLRAADGWREEAFLLLNGVSPNLNELRSRSTGNERLGRYADGLAAMNKNGLIPPNPEQAGRIFRELLDIRQDDPIGLASRYYLIQIEQSLNSAFEAKESFRVFYEQFPETFFGGLSLVKYAMLEAYSDDDKADALRRLAVLERLGKNLKIPDVKRDFRRIVGEAYLTFELSKEKAYKHLKDAADIGSTIQGAQADLLVRTGELAEDLGRVQDAIDLYSRFCDEMTFDARKPQIEQRLSRLSGNP